MMHISITYKLAYSVPLKRYDVYAERKGLQKVLKGIKQVIHLKDSESSTRISLLYTCEKEVHK